MADNTVTTVAPNKLTVGYERSVSVRPYETAKASIYVGADIAGSWSEDGIFTADEGAVNEAAKLAFFEAKVSVLSQLCLPYDVVENVVIESIDKNLGPVEVQSKPAARTKAPAQTVASGGGDWKSNAPSDKAGLKAELEAHPDRYWDNREDKRNPKSPDWKRKHTGEGIWLS